MPPRYKYMCYYVNCYNTNKTHSMFRFPVKDLDRLRKWIKNSGNIHLSNIEKNRWKFRFLCDEHFDSDYLNLTNKYPKLMTTAIPRPYEICEDERIDDINLKSPALDAESTMPPSKNQKPYHICMDVKCVETRRLLQDSRKTFKKQNAQITYLSKKIFPNNQYQHQYPSKESKTIVHMQWHNEMATWKKEEKDLSLALFNESPECYRFLLENGIVLPDFATINDWLSETTRLPEVAEDGGSVQMVEESEDDCVSLKMECEAESYASEEECEADFKMKCEVESDASEEECEADFGVSVKEEFEEENGSVTAPAGLITEHDIKCE